MPLIPLRVASVFANKEKEDFDDGDTSVLEKIKPVRYCAFATACLGTLFGRGLAGTHLILSCSLPHSLMKMVPVATLFALKLKG